MRKLNTDTLKSNPMPNCEYPPEKTDIRVMNLSVICQKIGDAI